MEFGLEKRFAVLWSQSPRTLLRQVDLPFIQYKSWNDPEAGSAISPLDGLRSLGNLGAETAWMRRDSNSAQIEAIRVPAGLDGYVRMITLVRVTVTRLIKQAKFEVS